MLTTEEKVQQRFYNDQPISEGRIVMYVLPQPDYKGHPVIRPMLVVRAWSNTCCNGQVFYDGSNDSKARGGDDHSKMPLTDWVTSSTFDAGENRSENGWIYVHYNFGTWHWPYRGNPADVQPKRI